MMLRATRRVEHELRIKSIRWRNLSSETEISMRMMRIVSSFRNRGHYAARLGTTTMIFATITP